MTPTVADDLYTDLNDRSTTSLRKLYLRNISTDQNALKAGPSVEELSPLV